ncbi:MAG: hypothetical protein GY711_21560 [bacterium]|nr:hypothetical protein [bacterium]
MVDHGDLITHMEWADAHVRGAIFKLGSEREDAWLSELLYHSHSVQWAYLHIWRGEPVELPRAERIAEHIAERCGDPPEVDCICWIWSNKPVPPWPCPLAKKSHRKP